MVVVIVIVTVAIVEAATTIKIWWHIGCRVGFFLGLVFVDEPKISDWSTILMLYSVVRMQFEYPVVPHYRVAFSSHSGPSRIHFGLILLG